MSGRNLLHVVMLYAAALASGYAMSLLRVPLTWMIGPMVLAAIVSLSGMQFRSIVRSPNPVRQFAPPLQQLGKPHDQPAFR